MAATPRRRLRLARFCAESVSHITGVWMWLDDAGIEREVSMAAVPEHWDDDCDEDVHGWAVRAGAMNRAMADCYTFHQSFAWMQQQPPHQRRRFWEGPCVDILLERDFFHIFDRQDFWNGSACKAQLSAAALELHALVFAHFTRRVQRLVRARRLARRVSALAAGRRAALAAGRPHQAELLAPLIAAWL